MARPDMIAERLVQLGFSHYEARTYVGLLVSDAAATGYGVSNDTGVPQPKVYETLRRLVERGAAVQVAERPARYAATPPSVLLGSLEREFQARLEAARAGLDSLPQLGIADPQLPVSQLSRFEAAVARAEAAISRARARVYLHARSAELRPLAPAVAAASERGVEFVIVHFGPLPFARPRGQVVRHESTEGTLYPSRNSRHLAVVVDSEWSLWALARDGEHWEGMHGDGALLAGLIKTYIRHDLFVQRMYADAPELFEERYGPGLLRLGLAPAEPAGGGSDEAADARDAG
jgi:HTH-type transcriptional regulator, sugar sensing transcriptional regulator